MYSAVCFSIVKDILAAKTPALCELVYPNGVMVRITSDLSLEGLRQLINLSR